MAPLDLDQQITESFRVVKLRQQQMLAAAIERDAGDIDSLDWDGFAARYAAAVREWQVLRHHKTLIQPAMAETSRGMTWVQK